MCDREMTLEEWVNRLPKIHLANKEYQSLIKRVTELEKERNNFAASLINLANKLGIDPAEAALQAGKPSDLFIAYITKLRADAVMEAANATDEMFSEGRFCPYENLTDYAYKIRNGEK